jgi:hypothetical protein
MTTAGVENSSSITPGRSKLSTMHDWKVELTRPSILSATSQYPTKELVRHEHRSQLESSDLAKTITRVELEQKGSKPARAKE